MASRFFLFWGMRMGKETDPFYGTDAWKRARGRALERDHYFCVECRKAGRRITLENGLRVPVPAEMVHHIQSIQERPDLRLTLSNLISLCNSCHAAKHPEKREAAGSAARRRETAPQPSLKGVRIVKMK